MGPVKGSMFAGKKQVVAIEHILRPKWLTEVNVKRCDGYFKVNVWNAGSVIVKDNSKFYDKYKTVGAYNIKEINMLGDGMIDFTTSVDGVDVYQCFSIAKPVLINRINRNGSDNELYVKYEESGCQGILFENKGEYVNVVSAISLDEEVVVNDIAISLKDGPNNLIKKYGSPTIRLYLDKTKDYKKQKSVNINGIVFTWGNKETKYFITLCCDIVMQELVLEIRVR